MIVGDTSVDVAVLGKMETGGMSASGTDRQTRQTSGDCVSPSPALPLIFILSSILDLPIILPILSLDSTFGSLCCPLMTAFSSCTGID